jgi:hypothetical protein
MSPGWSSDFSYEYFRRMLQALQANFETHLFSEVPGILRCMERQPKLVLRHDIDVSLKRALKMAEISLDFGVRATYMVMINSSVYRLDNETSREILRQLIAMGHQVALHFDVDDDQRASNCEISTVETKIVAARKHLEQIIRRPVQSISFHRPIPQFLRGPLFISGMVNAYSSELMDWYLTDSKGCWREGEPLPTLATWEKPLLQLLIHPIWWGDQHKSPEDRLQEFFETETQGQSYQAIEAFDTNLAMTIPAVRRRTFVL